VMSHVKQYFNSASPYKLVFTTTLHMNKRLCQNTIHTYLLERSYAGWYFYAAPRQTLSDKMEKGGFKKLKQEDFSYHYYMATKIDAKHFGRPASPTLTHMATLLFGVLVNPNLVAMALYTVRGEWMWQFSNKSNVFDASCKTCVFEHDPSKRPTTLFWSLNQYSEV